MAQRRSIRPVAPFEKALAAARDVSCARQRNFSSSVPFKASSSGQRAKAMPTRWWSCQASWCEGSDGDRIGHDDVVALSQQEAKKA